MPRSRFLNQTLLVAALTLAPIAVFAVGHRALVPPAAQEGQIASLGDLRSQSTGWASAPSGFWSAG